MNIRKNFILPKKFYFTKSSYNLRALHVNSSYLNNTSIILKRLKNILKKDYNGW